jgi:SAM-dependent methyltransferase
MIFPAPFSPQAYRRQNPDLRFLPERDLIAHYYQQGRPQGRIASEVGDRQSLLALLTVKRTLLEIGVFDRPSLDGLAEQGCLVDYADWLSRDELIQRARTIEGRDGSRVPDIRWVLSEGYGQIDVSYDAVVSHHCVEHQPDLVRHFLEVRSILREDGWYLFTVPDKRRCFDHFLPESTIVDLLEAYLLERKAPAFKSVLEHRCFVSLDYRNSLDTYRRRDPGLIDQGLEALREFRAADYVDVHCWTFTPYSFWELFNQLVDLEVLPRYRDFKVYPGADEFYVALAF